MERKEVTNIFKLVMLTINNFAFLYTSIEKILRVLFPINKVCMLKW